VDNGVDIFNFLLSVCVGLTIGQPRAGNHRLKAELFSDEEQRRPMVGATAMQRIAELSFTFHFPFSVFN